jgi:hypothetical protein
VIGVVPGWLGSTWLPLPLSGAGIPVLVGLSILPSIKP